MRRNRKIGQRSRFFDVNVPAEDRQEHSHSHHFSGCQCEGHSGKFAPPSSVRNLRRNRFQMAVGGAAPGTSDTWIWQSCQTILGKNLLSVSVPQVRNVPISLVSGRE